MFDLRKDLIQILLSALLSIIAYILVNATDDLEEISTSIQDLNATIKVLIIKGEQRVLRLNDHETRLRSLEVK